MIEIRINPGGNGKKVQPPFITIDNPWDETGYFSMTWIGPTPESLRRLADDLESANRKHAESCATADDEVSLNRIKDKLE